MKKNLKIFCEIVCLVLVLCMATGTLPMLASEAETGADTSPDTVNVLVPKNDIKKGKKITDANVELVTVKNANVPVNVISDLAEAVDKYAAVDLYAGEYIYFEQLSSKKVTASTGSDVMVKPVDENGDAFLMVTDYVLPNTGKDVTSALQELIDKNPNRTIYFPDGEYLISSPLKTPASSSKSVSLHLSGGAVIKASNNWKSAQIYGSNVNALICSGGTVSTNDIIGLGSYYSIIGGTLDGNGKADGLSMVSGRETLVRNICIKNVRIGVKIGRGVNAGSSDMDFEDITIIGTGRIDSRGIVVEGYDNTFTNIRIYDVQVGIEGGGGTHYKNIYIINRNIDKIRSYATTVAFSTSGNWISHCYVENFAVGFSVSSGTVLSDCVVKWTADICTTQTAVSAPANIPALSGIKAEFYGEEATTCFLRVPAGGGKPSIEGCTYNEELCDVPIDDSYINTPIIPID